MSGGILAPVTISGERIASRSRIQSRMRNPNDSTAAGLDSVITFDDVSSKAQLQSQKDIKTWDRTKRNAYAQEKTTCVSRLQKPLTAPQTGSAVFLQPRVSGFLICLSYRFSLSCYVVHIHDPLSNHRLSMFGSSRLHHPHADRDEASYFLFPSLSQNGTVCTGSRCSSCPSDPSHAHAHPPPLNLAEKGGPTCHIRQPVATCRFFWQDR